MSHSDPKTVCLSYPINKYIKTGKRSKSSLSMTIRGAWVGKDGQVLDKRIHIYRMWYRFLALALELEELGVSIIIREEKVYFPERKRDSYGHWRDYEFRPVTKEVKVNSEFYEDWDLKSIPHTSFDDWWKTHRDLFLESTTELMTSRNGWDTNPNHLFVRIDKRSRIDDTLNEVKRLIMEQRGEGKIESVSRFKVEGKPMWEAQVNRYNALILQLTTEKTDKEILGMTDAFRITKGAMEYSDEEGSLYKTGGGAQTGRVMRELLRPAKITLLSVCDGHFPYNPDKNYL